ncbi:MAG TPA: hypothetical protein VOA41_21585 [Candidatus Dormibacteraeota bacterium]|nr:hypothetical protein [Candidatus Dormibacteraeota bacterium]
MIAAPMIAALIFIFALAALLQFSISYCRSLINSYAQVVLSPDARECAALQSGPVCGEDFGRLLGMVRRSNVPGDDTAELGVARIYYLFVSTLRALCPATTATQQWLAQERSVCAHMVAVALDRRLTVGGGCL